MLDISVMLFNLAILAIIRSKRVQSPVFVCFVTHIIYDALKTVQLPGYICNPSLSVLTLNIVYSVLLQSCIEKV